MRRLGQALILIDCEEEHLDYICSILEAGCDANGYSYEYIPADASSGFAGYFKMVKET